MNSKQKSIAKEIILEVVYHASPIGVGSDCIQRGLRKNAVVISNDDVLKFASMLEDDGLLKSKEDRLCASDVNYTITAEGERELERRGII